MPRKTYRYKPDHPLANANGFVDVEELYGFNSTEDMRAVLGNTVVSVHYIPDEMAATRNMVDGKHYTSKHKFRAATKQAGCVEVGDQVHHLKPKQEIVPDRRQRREDIKKAIYELRNGRDIRAEVRKAYES